MQLQFRHQAKLNDPGVGRMRSRREAAFILSFWEVLMAVVIVAVLFGVIINGYLMTSVRLEWTGYSLAAQSLGVQSLERARSATWDIALSKNELTNLPLLSASYNASTKTYSGYMTNVLDLPYKGGNFVLATNYVTIQRMYLNNSSNVPVEIQLVKVDTVWPFTGWRKFDMILYTNTVCTLVAPDNRDPSTLGVMEN